MHNKNFHKIENTTSQLKNILLFYIYVNKFSLFYVQIARKHRLQTCYMYYMCVLFSSFIQIVMKFIFPDYGNLHLKPLLYWLNG